MSELENFRKQIDDLDKKIIPLLSQRLNVVINVGEYKKKHDIPVFDEKREQKVLKKVTDLCDEEKYHQALKKVYQSLMDEAKKLEE